MPKKEILLLALYCTGIIVGGGILALPLVSIDTGIIFLIFLLVILGYVFYLIYLRLLDSVGAALRDKVIFRTGLILYEEGLKYSNLMKYGSIAFTIGLALYTLPADIVYVLYGMKSLIQLSSVVTLNHHFEIMFIGLIMTAIIISSTIIYYRRIVYTEFRSIDLVLKILLMVSVWTATTSLIGLINSYDSKVIIASAAFSFSLIISEYFPESFLKNKINLNLQEDILPRHKASSYLTIFKLSLIIGTPILACVIILLSGNLTGEIILFPHSIDALIAATSIIIFMYVGSGIYNILIYNWIIKNRELGDKIVLYAILISMLTYIIFTLLILLSVDPSILLYSSIKREHAFISLSRKLEKIGLSTIGVITIIIANIFALVSVSIAYQGFTDTISDRLNIDTGLSRNAIWITITIIISISVMLLEINDISKIATDALGIAGNAGGGLFLLILPWLMKDSNKKRRIDLAIIFTIIITILNIFIIRESYSTIAKIIGIISLILVLIISILAIKEAKEKN